MKLDGLIRDLLALNRVARTGNRQRIRLVWKKKPDAVKTMAAIATRTEKSMQATKPAPTRNVAGILDRLKMRAGQ